MAYAFSGSSSRTNYKVTVTLMEELTTKTSTPVTASPISASGELIVEVEEIPDWACRGRLGRSCQEFPEDIGNPATIEQNYGQLGRFRIQSGVSAGSIRHDRCCSENKYGHFCPGTPKTYNISPGIKRACEREWEEAVSDWWRGSAWLGEWIYGGGGPSIEKIGAPAGPRLAPEDDQLCESKTGVKVVEVKVGEETVRILPEEFERLRASGQLTIHGPDSVVLICTR
jgi:hypothetical protein